MRAAPEVAAERRAKAARREELEGLIPDREAQAERLRENIGRAVAEGRAPADLRAELRALEDELDGLRRGVRVLAGEVEELKSEERRAQGAEADRVAEEAAGAAEKATAKAERAAADFLQRFAALDSEASVAFAEAVDAERTADRENGRRSPATPRVSERIAGRHPMMSDAPLGRVRRALRNAVLEAGLGGPSGA